MNIKRLGVSIVFSLVAFSSAFVSANEVRELRYEGIKNPKESDPSQRGLCKAVVVIDERGDVLEITGEIADPKAKAPKDSMWDSRKRSSGDKWTLTTDESKRLKNIKVTVDVSDTWYDNVLEIQDLDKSEIALRITHVFGLIDDAFAVPYTQKCKGLKRVGE